MGTTTTPAAPRIRSLTITRTPASPGFRPYTMPVGDTSATLLSLLAQVMLGVRSQWWLTTNCSESPLAIVPPSGWTEMEMNSPRTWPGAAGSGSLTPPWHAVEGVRSTRLVDDGLVGRQAGGPSDPNPWAAPGQIAVQLAGGDPVVDQAAAHPRAMRANCSCLNGAVNSRRPSVPHRGVSIRGPSLRSENYASQSASSNWGTQQTT